MKTLCLLLVSVGLLPAFARTVALWPLEADSSGKVDGRCVIDPNNDLTANDKTNNSAVVAQDVGWNLPPNPDAAQHAFEPLNYKAVRSVPQGANPANASFQARFLCSNKAGIHVERSRDFTIEGWLKLEALPARDAWSLVIGGYDDGSSRNRWTLSFRRRPSENYAGSWIVWANGGTDKVLYSYESEEATFQLTNTWMHVALVHDKAMARSGGTYDIWTLYINGAKVGDSQTETWSAPTSTESPKLDLGARQSGYNPTFGVFDYWRISDVPLKPGEFLCDGASGMSVKESATVAYWPLEATASGGVDGRDAVGNSPLSSGFRNATFKQNAMTPSEDCAFSGNPPNTTVTLAGGNVGCLQGAATSGCLEQNDVGALLDLSKSYTVEGWFSPRICEREVKSANQEVCCYLFGTRPDYGKGWSFQYRAKGVSNFQFDFYCVDQSGNLVNNSVFVNSAEISGWYEAWHHLALVFDKTGGSKGFGAWTLYLDGEPKGSVSCARAIAPVTDARPFILGGRAAIAEQSFQGKVDCVRVSQAALQQNQFLCATENPAAATDVIAFWPLNVKNGTYLDLRDVSGGNRHFISLDSQSSIQLVSGDTATDGPVISNPDRSPKFRGNPKSTHGSARFRNPDAATDTHRAYLETCSMDVRNAIGGGRDFTFECYYMRKASQKSVSNDQEVFMASADANTGVNIRFFRKQAGFYIWENRNGTINDTLIPGTSNGDMVVDKWYHVALVHTIESVDGVRKTRWRVYVDGDEMGSASTGYNGNTTVEARMLIGGRNWSDKNSVIGNLSSVRLSNRALTPSEFLCASPESPVDETPKTVAYWPIDNVSPVLANLVSVGCDLAAAGTAQGQNDAARNRVPNHTALPEVAGNDRRNQGSYALAADGSLTAPDVGHALMFTKPFTLEGWVNLSPEQTATDGIVVYAGDPATGTGLRIGFDCSGATPHLAVKAREDWPGTPIVEGTFDADLSAYVGQWTHFAVTYDPIDGTGTWTLYANGEKLGSPISNFYYPNSRMIVRCGDFRLGGVVGAFDMWRIASGVLKPDEFLYAAPAGLLIVVR